MQKLKANVELLKKHIESAEGYVGCEICKRNGQWVEWGGDRFPNPLQIHHVRFRSQGGDHGLHNIVMLCRACHDATHGKGPKGWPEKTQRQIERIVQKRNDHWGCITEEESSDAAR